MSLHDRGATAYVITYSRNGGGRRSHHRGRRRRACKALREAMDLSLRDLAERSGVSAPMLSPGRARRDEPDAAGRRAHRRRPRAAPVAAAAPRRGAARSSSCAPASGRRGGADGHAYEILTPPLPGQRAEVSRHTLAPGAVTGGPGDPPMHEPGARETALVERGARRRCSSTAPSHELAAGDCVTFDADLPHHFENHGKEEAVLLAVVSAGLRRS